MPRNLHEVRTEGREHIHILRPSGRVYQDRTAHSRLMCLKQQHCTVLLGAKQAAQLHTHKESHDIRIDMMTGHVEEVDCRHHRQKWRNTRDPQHAMGHAWHGRISKLVAGRVWPTDSSCRLQLVIGCRLSEATCPPLRLPCSALLPSRPACAAASASSGTPHCNAGRVRDHF